MQIGQTVSRFRILCAASASSTVETSISDGLSGEHQERSKGILHVVEGRFGDLEGIACLRLHDSRMATLLRSHAKKRKEGSGEEDE